MLEVTNKHANLEVGQKSHDIPKLRLDKKQRDRECERLLDSDTHTSILWQSIPGYIGSCIVILALFLAVGAIDGHQYSVYIILQSQGVTYADMSIFSLAKYPMLLKLLFAPIMDGYYITAFGKSKTYILASGIGLVAVCFIASIYTDDLVANNRVVDLVWIFVVVNMLAAVFQVAAIVWITTIFETENKGKGSFVKPIGEILGYFFTASVFIPLNNVSWLNKYVYADDSQTRNPLFEHWHIMVGVAVIILAILAYITFFVAEKRIKGEQYVDLLSLLKFVPSILKNSNMLTLMIYMVLINGVHFLVVEIVSYMLITNGISKESFVIMDTLLFPLTIIVNLLCQRYLFQGSFMRTGFFMAVIGFLAISGKFAVACYANSHPHWMYAYHWIFFFKAVIKFSAPLSCFVAYIVQIADPRASSTIISILLTFMFASTLFPKTLGFLIANYVSIVPFVIVCKLIHLLSLVLLYSTAIALDDLGPVDYPILRSDTTASHMRDIGGLHRDDGYDVYAGNVSPGRPGVNKILVITPRSRPVRYVSSSK